MKIIEGMNYRQWQKRNTNDFNLLTKIQQKEIRQQGYCNQGWNKVQTSWNLINKLTKNVVSLFEYKLSSGDVLGAIELSILEAEQAKNVAKKAIKKINSNKKHLDKLADKALAQYPLL